MIRRLCIFFQLLSLYQCGLYVSAKELPLAMDTSSYIRTNDEDITVKSDDLETLRRWKSGETVNRHAVNLYGMDKCFCATLIEGPVFQRIRNNSYKDSTVPLDDLRYLKILHYNLQKEIKLGELICHKSIASDLLEIFRQLFEAKYPIERMLLIDNFQADDELSMQANNSSCFNFRTVKGSKTLSKHSLGLAIDINPLFNPYIKVRKGKVFIQPKTAEKYLKRESHFPYKIVKGDLCYRLFKIHGFKWGGDWKSVKDFQHFEK